MLNKLSQKSKEEVETHLLKKMFRSMKAISPILATLLLIVIAVSAIVITYAWVTTFLTGTTGGAGVILNKDNVSWNSTAGTITIYVRNTGTSDAEIDDVYVGTTSTNLARQTSVTYDPTSAIAYANGGTVAITVTYSWSVDTTYYFKVAPKAGAPLEFNAKSPSS
jgi:flagellin-like protein